VYAIVPVLMLGAVAAQRRSSLDVPAACGLPPRLRAVLAGLALVLVALGVALLVAPGWADAAWPWPLTELTGRAVGAWCLGLGVAAAHARLLDEPRMARPLAVTAIAFGVLQGAALLRHGDELDWGGVAAWAYVAVLAILGAAGAWTLRLERRAGPLQVGPEPTP
jgi:hypothetical protein